MNKFAKLPKPKKGAWFVSVRGSYIPVSWQGWLTYIPYVGYLIVTFLIIDRNSHSVSDTLIGLIPYWVSGVVVMHWIAARKS